ncbi:MAG TPA: nitroreductase family deazaflavin-dependent oxidoreductase [Humibacillus sp.]|nr:nitroreductase family deazaflavin-dependent oxidoreductase [Humibacillus sp.]
MATLRHRMMRRGNAIGLWFHRRFRGRLDSGGSATVLMLTSPGRRTGQPRSVMVRYLPYDGGYLVWGTGSGSPTEPDWFRNLRRATRADVEIGTTSQPVTPRVLTGPERDRVWREVVLAAAPGVAKYEAKAGRIIPVAVLQPVEPKPAG